MGIQLNKIRTFGLMAVASLAIAACTEPAPTTKKVASFPPNEGIVTINIYQKLEGTFYINNSNYQFDAYGTALRGYVWREAGAQVTRKDALRSARAYCGTLGSSIASGYYSYGREDSTYAGVYFNCR